MNNYIIGTAEQKTKEKIETGKIAVFSSPGY